jgi:molybdopterin-guanine dinucleotide biosynthesis protein A
MQFQGKPLILRILERMADHPDEIILSTNQPAGYEFLGLPLQPDILPGRGALGGLYTALTIAHHSTVAVVACDMPFANPDLFEHECEILTSSGVDVVIPSTPHGLEPLHAVYRRDTCLPVIRSELDAGRLKLAGWLTEVNVRVLKPEEQVRFDPYHLAFLNLNTPDDFRQAEELAMLHKI